MARTALWQAVKKAHPNLTDKHVDQLMDDNGKRMAQLHRSGMLIHQARELANADGTIDRFQVRTRAK